MAALIVKAVLASLCLAAFWNSYANYVRFIAAVRDPEKSRRSLQIAIHARNDGQISDAEFERIEGGHYRPYQRRFIFSLLAGLSIGGVGALYLLG